MPVATPGVNTGIVRLGGIAVLYARASRGSEADTEDDRTQMSTPTSPPTMTRAVAVWILRVAWITLPLTAGPAAGAVLAGWSDALAIAAEALLWASWAAGLLAVIAPNPTMLTVVRAIAPMYVVLALAAALDGAPSALAVVGAIASTVLASALTSGSDLALAAANTLSYGDELRVPLRTPPSLFLGLLPAARVLAVAAVAGPVLLLAAEQWVAGAVAVVAGVGLLAFLPRRLVVLSRRWAVLVPAGFVVVDPMTLADPLLFLRERVLRLAACPPGAAPDGATDLRLGATRGSLVARFDEDAEITLAGRGRTPATTIPTPAICIAVVRHAEFLRHAAARRLRVR